MAPNYQMIKEFSKDGDRIIIKNYLKIYGNKKEVPFEYIGNIFYDVLTLERVICPKGTYHPYNKDGDQYSVTNFYNPDNRKWNLYCIKHDSGIFLAYYFGNKSKGLYGYSPSQGRWDGGNEYRQICLL